MIMIRIVGFIFIFGPAVLSVVVPFLVAWKTYFGNKKVWGVSVHGWVCPWALIAGGCASVLIASELPELLMELLAGTDALVGVGIFFLGVVACSLFPLSLLVGRCVRAIWRVARGHWVSPDSGRPEIVWILLGVLLVGMASILMGMHWCNTRLRADVSNRAASPETLRAVYQKSRHNWVDYDIKLKLAEHPRLPKDIAESLASSDDLAIRIRIADNPETDVNVLRKLSHDSDYWIRGSVAWRNNCPDDVLSNLCVDSQVHVRQAAFKQMEKRKVKNAIPQP